jgi:tRNA pseudouridine38-40 synthase
VTPANDAAGPDVRASGPAVRVRVDLAYDGAPYAGFARQPGHLTVQGELEEALALLLGHRIRTVVAGRTDRGVHATAQVVHLDTTEDALVAVGGVDALRVALDTSTSPAIAVRALRRVPRSFDARFSATARYYRYRLRDDVDPRAPGPEGAPPGARGVHRDARDVWGLVHRLDVPAMREAGRHLLGEHDFSAFCRRAPGRTTRRRVDRLTIERLEPAPGRIDIRVIGPAFCHQQVRSIVGCLVEVGRGRQPSRWLAEVLASGDRALAAPVAPPHGLTLERVTFGPGRPASPPSVHRGVRGLPGPG